MKIFYESFVVAFSMYSKIPMPKISWSEKNMKYTYLFFPFVGATLGGIMAICFMLAQRIEFQPVFWAAIFVAVPILFTGGIHLDGFCDTCDALSSHQSREEKLRIMKDPNVGAFALIHVCLLFLVQLGAFTQLIVTPKYAGMVLMGFFLSRCLSCYAIVRFPCAKTSGLAATFASGADKKLVQRALIFYALLGSGLMIWWVGAMGALLLFFVALFYSFFYRLIQKEFGGITGDLAGFCTQIVELICLVFAAVAGGSFL